MEISQICKNLKEPSWQRRKHKGNQKSYKRQGLGGSIQQEDKITTIYTPSHTIKTCELEMDRTEGRHSSIQYLEPPIPYSQ